MIRIRSRTPNLSHGAAVALATLLALAAGCGPGQVDQFNNPAEITAVGPVSFDGTEVLIDYTLRDQEGDDQSLSVEICAGDESSQKTCPTPVQGTGGDGIDLVPTVPRATDAEHRFAWAVGCGRVDGDSCVDSKTNTEYTVRLSVDGTDEQASSEPFTLEDLSADALPECGLSAGNLPDPCNPNDSGNSQ